MNGLRTSFTVISSAALKGKGKQALEQLPMARIALGGSRNIAASRSSQQQQPQATAAVGSDPSSAGPSSPISSNQDALTLIKSQPNHYAVASITGRTYIITKGDLVTMPRLKDVQIGDMLVLDKVHEIGSRDFTLRAQDTLNMRRISTAIDLSAPHPKALSLSSSSSPLVPQTRRLFTRLAPAGLDAIAERSHLLPLADTWSSRLLPNGLAHIGASLPTTTVRITAVVTEHTKGSLEKILKKKRRKGYKKTVQHKQPYTRIRIEDIQIGPAN
ncbi:hypothetical protein BCV70DRAFT_19041 [Testicularia cyperi]|uniref:Large ribosomal subunit protein bL21m n=1 Tax=Testicularia cyperi TaxID=1882483 RepID=A0A317XZ13_9BASI|nr:hypothetical protein BCV70DRAFT_19041 [Testicularia cyperi]